MEAIEDLSAARMRERLLMCTPWTIRRQRPEQDVFVDVDAFNLRDGAALAAAHWDIDADLIHVEGRPRWPRWIGLVAHDSDDSEMGRGWWIDCTLGVRHPRRGRDPWASHQRGRRRAAGTARTGQGGEARSRNARRLRTGLAGASAGG